MSRVIIESATGKKPISLIGEMAGVCWNADTSNNEKNYMRGIDCLKSNHGRTLEYPQVFMVLDGYSARVIREFYTHIGGMPTRLQASTRYINYEKGFDYVLPYSIAENSEAFKIYDDEMRNIADSMRKLQKLGISREDYAMLLPLGMRTKVVVRTNLRNLLDMAEQRLCNRAYWEYRELMQDIINALSDYSEEWEVLSQYFMPKCKKYGKCTEKRGCKK